MSWLSEIAHDQGKVTLFAAIVAFAVGMTGSIVALIIGWRQGTASRLSAEAAKASAGTASSAIQCRSNLVSSRGLPKTGIIQMPAGDYRLFRSGTA
jgi:hypothetical protein